MKAFVTIWIALAVAAAIGVLSGYTHHIATVVICLGMAYASNQTRLKDRHNSNP